jgi:glycine/D-amino acid oxidase-like deaminating enzyme
MPAIRHVPSDTDLPKQAAVCVIGGGVAGVATALELAERGIDVVLLEKGEIAAEQSSRMRGSKARPASTDAAFSISAKPSSRWRRGRRGLKPMRGLRGFPPA